MGAPGRAGQGPPAARAPLVLGQGLDQQEAGAGVDLPVVVEVGGRDLSQRAVAAGGGVVAHQGVKPAQLTDGLSDQRRRCRGIGQVGAGVCQTRLAHEVATYGLDHAGHVVGAPGLGGVVRGEVLQEQARPHLRGSAGDGVADPGAARDPGDHDDPAGQGQGARDTGLGAGQGGAAW